MGVVDSPKEKTFSEIFEECFPFYLSIGMTYEQFWEGDSTLPIFYRKAEKLKAKSEFEKMNQSKWLQGMYFYEALCCASPILRTNLGKGKVTVEPYRDKPYVFDNTKKQEEQRELDRKKKEKDLLKAQLFFKNWARANQHLSEGGGV